MVLARRTCICEAWLSFLTQLLRLSMGLFEGTANSIMKALRKAIAYVVFCNVLSGWVMFDDSVNPKHAPIHSWRGKIMFPIFLGTSIVMAVLNGTCAYMAIFFQLKGKCRCSESADMTDTFHATLQCGQVPSCPFLLSTRKQETSPRSLRAM